MKILEIALTHIDGNLISADQMARILSVARKIPSEAVNFFGFETVLSGDQPKADFAFNLSNAGNKWLAEGNLENHPQLTRLCKDWGESGQTPFDDGGNIWLEYDTSDSANPDGEPSVFLAFTDIASLREMDSGGKRSQGWIRDHLLTNLVVADAVAPIADLLALCFAHLPASTRKIQFGLLLSRKFPGIRLCIFNFKKDTIVPFLGKISWKGNLDNVSALTDRYADCCDSFCIQLDIGYQLYPTLGIELIHEGEHPWNWQPPLAGHWDRSFARLQNDGLCTGQKAELLLNFPKKFKVSVPLVELLANYFQRTAGSVSDQVENGTLILGLQHLKLKLDISGKVVAKGYFGGQFEPVFAESLH